jgi:hypothetical protein
MSHFYHAHPVLTVLGLVVGACGLTVFGIWLIIVTKMGWGP